MKISIVTVCKNSEKYIEKAIQSVQAQTYEDIEYIIIDGLSQDSTKDIIARYTHAISHFMCEADSGIYSAMNKGIKAATGDFIYFLNSDDYLVDHTVIEDVAEFINKHSDGDIIYGNLEVREPSGQVHVFTPPVPEGIADFMIYGSMPHQATFSRKDLFEKFGYFDEKYKVAADVAWYLNLLPHSELNWYRLNRTIGSYYNGGQTLSNVWITRNEFWEIQNQAHFYQSEEWYQKRIKKLQAIILDYENQLNAHGEKKLTASQANDPNQYHLEALEKATRQILEKQEIIKKLRSQLKESRAKLKVKQQSTAQIEKLKDELQSAYSELEAVKSSKFWKLRSLWFGFKSRLLSLASKN